MSIKPSVQWTGIVAGTVALALGVELYAAFDGDDATMPWTGYIARQPGWLIILETLVFFVWWPIHIYLAHKRVKDREYSAGMNQGQRVGYTLQRNMTRRDLRP